MSRVIAFDLQNYSVGEFSALFDRGWMVQGVNSTSGGGRTSMRLSRDVQETGWLMPGRIVLVERPPLPAWAGVVDTPINLMPPGVVTVYGIEYLLRMRAPDVAGRLNGTIADITRQLLDLANAQEELFLRMGTEGGSSTYREEPLDQRSFWEQLLAMIQRSRSELMFRPKREPGDGNRLFVYVDVLERAGEETGFELKDGQGGNMRVNSATLDGEIWNRVIGINGSPSATERLVTAPQIDEESIGAFRLRSRVVQFRNTVLASTLAEQTQQSVQGTAMPRIKFNLSVFDVGETFRFMAPGNGVLLHASKAVLPDGRRGWRGAGSILAMGYDEAANTLGMTVEAVYEL